MADDALPPLPAGFALDSTPAGDAVPPLPSGFTLDAPRSPSAAAPVTYDANLFKQRVGRDPESPSELANFAAQKGVGWAGDPGTSHFTAGQGAVGVGEDALALSSGALMAIPAGVTYLATGGDIDKARAVQNFGTYQPMSDAGRAGLKGLGEVPGSVGQAILKGADTLDSSGQLSAALSDVGERTAVALGAVPILGEAGALVRGGGVTRTVAGAAQRVGGAVRDVARGGDIPAGTQFDRSGTAITPKPAPAAPVADVPGASAATPPIFDTAAPGATPPPPAGFTVDSAPAAEAAPAEATAAATKAAEDQRAATLKNAGFTQARDSAVTGDKMDAASDYYTAKVDNEGGRAAQATFQNERDTLGNYTDQLVGDAGGSSGLDETSLHNRGQTILQPLQDLRDLYNSKISDLYGQADVAAQGMPLELPGTGKALADRASFIGTTEGQQLLRGVNAYLRQAGIADDAGTIGTATVQQAERLKQYLNSQWSPRTARLIGTLKDAIDDDVTANAGTDVYKQARAMRAARAAALDNPKGVASLLDASGPDGVNRAVPVERVPDQVARMPADQFEHVVKALETARDNGIGSAQAALNEIRSQHMLRLQEKGQSLKGAWNNKGVTQYLKSNSGKLARVFSPSELARMTTLNDAGNILDVDRSYPGAPVLEHNLQTRGLIFAAEHAPGAIAGHLLGPVGVVGGEMLGKAVSNTLKASASKKAWQARVRKL